MSNSKQLIIIGGGAMGVSLLYHLAKLGWQDILLIEKNELTAGSTWHAAGLCTHFAHSPTIMNMRAYSARLYGGELTADTGEPVSFHQCGALRVTRCVDRMNEFRQVLGLGEFLGFPFEIIAPQDLSKLHPLTLQGDGLLGGIYEPWDGYVDPSQATQAMAAGARQRGADIMRHTCVTATQQNADGSWLVSTDKGQFTTQHLVNAAGTWGYEVGQMMGMDLPMVPMLHQYLVTDKLDAVAELERELPMLRDPEESWYLRQEGDGFIFGSYEKAGIPWSIDRVPKAFGMELLPPDLDAMLPIMSMAMERVPALQEAGIKTIVNGPITFTPDAAPLIGPAFGVRNGWLLTGSSMGVMEGGGAGHFLAHWIHTGAPPYDAQVLDSRRFGAYANGDYRVTKAVECFGRQFGLHYPVEQLPAGRNQRLSPLHNTWLQAGAIMNDAYGWERPDYFSTQANSKPFQPSFGQHNGHQEVARECALAQTSLAYIDLSLFAKFLVTGPEASQFMQQLGANSAPTSIGKIGLMHVLADNGGVKLEFTVTCEDSNQYYLNTAAAAERIAWQTLVDASQDWQISLQNMTDSHAILGVFGPQAVRVLEAASQQSLDQANCPWLSSCQLTIGEQKLRALRLSYIGEAGFELHAPRQHMQSIYAAIEQCANDIERGPIGMFAVNAMRLEKGYAAWGMDLTTERTPLESGIQYLVKSDNRDFTGRTAMLAKQSTWQLQLCQVDNAPGDCFGGQPVYQNERIIGIVSSGAYGYRSQLNLALVWFRETPSAEPMLVKRLGEYFPLQISQQVPYDASNQRLRQ